MQSGKDWTHEHEWALESTAIIGCKNVYTLTFKVNLKMQSTSKLKCWCLSWCLDQIQTDSPNLSKMVKTKTVKFCKLRQQVETKRSTRGTTIRCRQFIKKSKLKNIPLLDTRAGTGYKQVDRNKHEHRYSTMINEQQSWPSLTNNQTRLMWWRESCIHTHPGHQAEWG